MKQTPREVQRLFLLWLSTENNRAVPPGRAPHDAYYVFRLELIIHIWYKTPLFVATPTNLRNRTHCPVPYLLLVVT